MLLLNGDCIEQMQKLIDDGVQVDSVVTDPPYHLASIVKRFGKEGSAPAQYGTDGAFKRAATGFMGKEWDGGDIAFRPETWELALKLLKPGGHILAFSASRNYHRMAVAIEDAGFEIRDQMMWLYGSGFPKSLNIGKAIDKKQDNKREVIGTQQHPTSKDRTGNKSPYQAEDSHLEATHEITKGNTEWEGWGTALKPAHEPIVMARKPISEKSIADNVLKHGTGGINIDGCRIEGEGNTERKITNRKTRSEDGVWTDGNSGMKAEGSQYADADPRGRFPANVMHDGSEEVLKVFPSSSKSAGGGGVKTTGKNVYGKYNGREYDKTIGYGDDGSAARYFYCPKTSKAEKNKGLDGFTTKQTQGGGGGIGDYNNDVNSASGKYGSEKAPSKNTHPTVKPIKLMRYLCRLVTPKGGTVLDPFMGSGSTGIAAKDEGFEFIGIEREKEYFEIAEQRVSVASPLEEFMK